MGTADPGASDEDVVRAFFAVYNDQAPERFDNVVAADYLDYGHQPPGRGPQGARDDYESALRYGAIQYDIDALVVDGDGQVAVAWTGHIPNIVDPLRGISLYTVRNV